MAPLTAGALIAQQVASNAVRDTLFLTWFEVTSRPYFMIAATVFAIPAADSSFGINVGIAGASYRGMSSTLAFLAVSGGLTIIASLGYRFLARSI